MELHNVTADNKDGLTLAKHFGDIIDRVEKTYGCTVTCFLTDANGGSKKGCELLVKERQTLMKNRPGSLSEIVGIHLCLLI